MDFEYPLNNHISNSIYYKGDKWHLNSYNFLRIAPNCKYSQASSFQPVSSKRYYIAHIFRQKAYIYINNLTILINQFQRKSRSVRGELFLVSAKQTAII